MIETLNAFNQTAENSTSFVILVDSIESTREPAHLLRVLDSIISSVPYPWFKVIATIQTGAYGAIANEHDKLDWQPIVSTKYYLPNDNNVQTALPGVTLRPFNLPELRGAWDKAQIGTNLGLLPKASRDLIRHPYFFKLFIELYKSSANRESLFAVSTVWELSKYYYENRLPLLKNRHRNPSRILLNQLIGRLLENRSIWFSILDLAEDTIIGRYFIDYESNKPYANLINLGLLQEYTTPDLTDIKVSFKPNPLFAYALYRYFCEYGNITVDQLMSIVTELLPGPMGFDLDETVTHADLDRGIEAINYFRILRSFWYLPLVEAIAHLLVDRWTTGEEETFVFKFFVENYSARNWLATESISIKNA